MDADQYQHFADQLGYSRNQFQLNPNVVFIIDPKVFLHSTIINLGSFWEIFFKISFKNYVGFSVDYEIRLSGVRWDSSPKFVRILWNMKHDNNLKLAFSDFLWLFIIIIIKDYQLIFQNF